MPVWQTIPIAGLAALVLLGPATPPARAETAAAAAQAAEQDSQFMTWLNALLERVKADPKYRRLPIDSAAQQQDFMGRLHAAYRGRMTAADFTTWADKAYPGHAYEVGVITRQLPK